MIYIYGSSHLIMSSIAWGVSAGIGGLTKIPSGDHGSRGGKFGACWGILRMPICDDRILIFGLIFGPPPFKSSRGGNPGASIWYVLIRKWGHFAVLMECMKVGRALR